MYDFDGYQMQIATRGSFASEQAMQANKILSSNNYAWTNYRDWTMLFEIIYPENRIVVNYNGMEELVYLGEVHNRTGEFRFEPDNFSGPSAAPLWEGSFRGLLECPAREGQEGLVVHDRSGNMVKVKYEEYVRLHRIITHLNEKTVWEAMNGPRLEPVHELAKELDEEHRAWLYDVAMKLMGDYMYLAVYVQEVAARVDVKNKTRKEVALAIREEPKVIQSAIFRGLDNKSYVDVLWKSIKPQEVREGEFTDE
jgi:RNA ligase